NSPPASKDKLGGKISLYPKHNNNPYLIKAINEIQIAKRYQVDTDEQKALLNISDPNTGELVGHSMFAYPIEVDKEKFAKVYLSQLESFWELPKSAIRVLCYILTKLKPKNDKFEFLLQECMRYSKYKNPSSVYNGLSSLIEAGI